jgi:hypothetical protein
MKTLPSVTSCRQESAMFTLFGGGGGVLPLNKLEFTQNSHVMVRRLGNSTLLHTGTICTELEFARWSSRLRSVLTFTLRTRSFKHVRIMQAHVGRVTVDTTVSKIAEL